ncbi:hypothetical protein STCU_03404 [Strigomonas culicis]|uniref:Ubiquitin-like domain-containing protein n=1 Tax=Strigomonas culicis TaxID=28005 RepID=S9VWV4_9TRYP|nr:hypothetical protein STCU_03404 [Strigomonas culicis]|eukprot:EPY31541.1 hypothetical protein STCU_03404 [Strigomonas culicis]
MKVVLKWFATGKVSDLEETSALLNPDTTIAEVKGLIQIRFGFLASEVLLIKEHLLENRVSLRSLGIVGLPTDPALTAHVVRMSELEASNLDVDDTSHDDDLQEFTHADFILAMKMLGKQVPVSDERIVQMRMNAPRQHPAFLDAMGGKGRAGGPGGAMNPAPPMGMPGLGGNIQAYNPRNTEVCQIFLNVRYGPRKEGVDQMFAIPYPGVEPFAFWDMRPPDVFTSAQQPCSPGEVVMELFYFGEFSIIKDHQKFLALVKQSVETKVGVRVQTPLPMREAGCMYPLVACPVILSELDAMELGDVFFEDFGKMRTGPMLTRNPNDANVAGNGGCGAQ